MKQQVFMAHAIGNVFCNLEDQSVIQFGRAKKGVAASVLGAPLRLAPAYGLGSRAFMPSVFVQTAPREKAGLTLSTSSSICFQRLLPLLD